LTSHLIAEYPVSLVAAPKVKITRGKFPNNLRHLPLILPGRQSAMRAPFDRMLTAAGIQPHIAAECDDMAMLRLLAREGIGVALVPPIVVKDELKSGALREITKVDGLTKAFYAVTQRRQFPNVIVNELIQRISRGDASPGISAPTSKSSAVPKQR
jgi:LysR family transcriptional activator of nhaA